VSECGTTGGLERSGECDPDSTSTTTLPPVINGDSPNTGHAVPILPTVKLVDAPRKSRLCDQTDEPVRFGHSRHPVICQEYPSDLAPCTQYSEQFPSLPPIENMFRVAGVSMISKEDTGPILRHPQRYSFDDASQPSLLFSTDPTGRNLQLKSLPSPRSLLALTGTNSSNHFRRHHSLSPLLPSPPLQLFEGDLHCQYQRQHNFQSEPLPTPFQTPNRLPTRLATMTDEFWLREHSSFQQIPMAFTNNSNSQLQDNHNSTSSKARLTAAENLPPFRLTSSSLFNALGDTIEVTTPSTQLAEKVVQKPARGTKIRAKSKRKVITNGAYACDICPRTFDTGNGLSIHLNWHQKWGEYEYILISSRTRMLFLKLKFI
jgi:hypothetical protein